MDHVRRRHRPEPLPLDYGRAQGTPLYLVASVGGAAWSLVGGALANYLLEMAPINDRPAYLAWYNLALNAGILGGSLQGPVLMYWGWAFAKHCWWASRAPAGGDLHLAGRALCGSAARRGGNRYRGDNQQLRMHPSHMAGRIWVRHSRLQSKNYGTEYYGGISKDHDGYPSFSVVIPAVPALIPVPAHVRCLAVAFGV